MTSAAQLHRPNDPLRVQPMRRNRQRRRRMGPRPPPPVRWVRVQPDRVADLASSRGSVENLNVSPRHGCNPHLRKIRATHTFESHPGDRPANRLDQCLTPSRCGRSSSAANTTATSSTTGPTAPAWVDHRARRSPAAEHRLFHAITVGLLTRHRLRSRSCRRPNQPATRFTPAAPTPPQSDGVHVHRINSARCSAGSGTATSTVNDMSPTARLFHSGQTRWRRLHKPA
jgi:hypothetical protein